MTTPRVPQMRTPHAELVALSETDISDVACFIAIQSGRPREKVDSHLRWFLLENPAHYPGGPLGFGLRSGSQLVGCILCSPQTFRIEKKQILLMGSSSFYVDDSCRGHGGRIFLQYCRLAMEWPLFGTSANAEAAALWKAAGAKPIPGSNGELFGVLRWAPVVEEFAHRKNPSRALSRLAGTPVSNLVSRIRPLKIDGGKSGALQPLSSAEQVAELLTENFSTKLTATRDLPYIRWRYFSGRDATTAVFAFRNRASDRGNMVTVNQRPRGYREQINTLNVLDVFPEATPEEWLRIAGALAERYRKVVDAIVLRGLDPEWQKIFCDRGFRWRAFDAPNGWWLDRFNLLPPHDCYFVPADGDGLI